MPTSQSVPPPPLPPVRELFAAAKKNAPSVVFIDEIDSIGAKRQGAMFSGNNQTLNQILPRTPPAATWIWSCVPTIPKNKFENWQGVGLRFPQDQASF